MADSRLRSSNSRLLAELAASRLLPRRREAAIGLSYSQNVSSGYYINSEGELMKAKSSMPHKRMSAKQKQPMPVRAHYQMATKGAQHGKAKK